MTKIVNFNLPRTLSKIINFHNRSKYTVHGQSEHSLWVPARVYITQARTVEMPPKTNKEVASGPAAGGGADDQGSIQQGDPRSDDFSLNLPTLLRHIEATWPSASTKTFAKRVATFLSGQEQKGILRLVPATVNQNNCQFLFYEIQVLDRQAFIQDVRTFVSNTAEGAKYRENAKAALYTLLRHELELKPSDPDTLNKVPKHELTGNSR
jgi:hypothetical protein